MSPRRVGLVWTGLNMDPGTGADQTKKKKKNPRPTGQYGFGELGKKECWCWFFIGWKCKRTKNEANNNTEKVNKKR